MSIHQTPSIALSPVEPFLRWAGGKRWLSRQIYELFPDLEFANYHEPFLGGGALFFSLRPKAATLSDANERLIETYQAVRDAPNEVIEALGEFRNAEDEYYRIRASKFELLHERAAQFIYLNKTSFNGIYRVNLKGQYNVPYGGKGKVHFEPESIRLASKALEGIKLRCSDFYTTIEGVGEGDLVYIDPPYTVSHNRNGFIKYNKNLFCLEDQRRLSRFMSDIDSRGARYILSNADHPVVEDVFSSAPKCHRVSRASLLGGRQASRGRVTELLFTNIPGGA